MHTQLKRKHDTGHQKHFMSAAAIGVCNSLHLGFDRDVPNNKADRVRSINITYTTDVHNTVCCTRNMANYRMPSMLQQLLYTHFQRLQEQT